MRINQDLTIAGQTCMLVPYRPEHVEVYHAWMQDPFLQATTESEPLTLEQEHAMQASWRDDDDKCTFIVLDLTQAAKGTQQQPAVDASVGPGTDATHRQLQLMAGDVNLYFNDPDDRTIAEIEVMVAEPRSRRKGIAREALLLMMAFGVQRLDVTRFRAKILEDNTPSLELFRKLGYQETRRVPVFREVHMEWDVTAAAPGYTTQLPALQYGRYDS